MADYNIANDLLVRGTSCWVRVGNSASDAQTVGFVDTFEANKQIQLQEANVCGSIVPASIDPQGIRCSLSLGGFLATSEVYKGTQTYNGGGKVSLASFNPDDDDFVNKQVITKFGYMDFYDDKAKQILASFKTAIPESYRISGNGGSYIKSNISLRAIKMSSGSDYTTTFLKK